MTQVYLTRLTLVKPEKKGYLEMTCDIVSPKDEALIKSDKIYIKRVFRDKGVTEAKQTGWTIKKVEFIKKIGT